MNPHVIAFKATRRLRGRDITIRRDDHSVALRALLGNSSWDEVDQFGRVSRVTSKDFVILASELVLDGRSTLPRESDRVEIELDGSNYRFEAMPADGQQCFKMVDPEGHELIRIHTKQIDVDRPGAFDQAFSEEFQ